MQAQPATSFGDQLWFICVVLRKGPLSTGTPCRTATQLHSCQHHEQQTPGLQQLCFAEAHWDWFGRDLGNGSDTSSGDRVATVLMYLSDVEDHAGGETSLPLATPVEGADEQDTSQLSPCAARMGLAVRPRKVRPWPSLQPCAVA